MPDRVCKSCGKKYPEDKEHFQYDSYNGSYRNKCLACLASEKRLRRQAKQQRKRDGSAYVNDWVEPYCSEFLPHWIKANYPDASAFRFGHDYVRSIMILQKNKCRVSETVFMLPDRRVRWDSWCKELSAADKLRLPLLVPVDLAAPFTWKNAVFVSAVFREAIKVCKDFYSLRNLLGIDVTAGIHSISVEETAAQLRGQRVYNFKVKGQLEYGS
jgi:hypothetical protein